MSKHLIINKSALMLLLDAAEYNVAPYLEECTKEDLRRDKPWIADLLLAKDVVKMNIRALNDAKVLNDINFD